MINLNDIRNNIDLGLYDKEIDEPTPLEKKKILVWEVKTEFTEDLLSLGVPLKTINLAWDLSEEINGADEALNSIFLYTVLNYIDILEEFKNEV